MPKSSVLLAFSLAFNSNSVCHELNYCHLLAFTCRRKINVGDYNFMDNMKPIWEIPFTWLKDFVRTSHLWIKYIMIIVASLYFLLLFTSLIWLIVENLFWSVICTFFFFSEPTEQHNGLKIKIPQNCGVPFSCILFLHRDPSLQYQRQWRFSTDQTTDPWIKAKADTFSLLSPLKAQPFTVCIYCMFHCSTPPLHTACGQFAGIHNVHWSIPYIILIKVKYSGIAPPETSVAE